MYNRKAEIGSKKSREETATLYGLIKVAKKLKMNLEDVSASSLLITSHGSNSQPLSHHSKTMTPKQDQPTPI